jgi:hypothetical protein
VLTGATGSLCTLLDACLVNGYGSQAAAGWTIAYTGTSLRSYKQGAGSNGYYLDVVDNGPGGGSFREARMRGYETMTALSTGTQAFPTVAQSSFGAVCRKSSTADATARPWYLLADSTCFYLFVDTGDLVNPSYSCSFMFGDFFSYKSGDTWNTAIIGRQQENGGVQAESFAMLTQTATNLPGNASNSVWSGHWLDRLHTGVGGSQPFGKHSSLMAGNLNASGMNGTIMGTTTSQLQYPNGPDGALEMAPVWIALQSAVRGYLKGIWCPLHCQPCGHGDTFTGTGPLAGKSFMALNIFANIYYFYNNAGAAVGGQVILETSNTWS